MNLESTVVFILILGVLVIFHEFGHFITAKLAGVRVEEFAFGFGPRLVTLFKRQDTEYTIHAFPLGGFVKLAGMEIGEEDVPDGFQGQSIWKRVAVIFAGPLFSFILAVLVFESIGIFWGFQDESKTLNRVLMVNPQTAAAKIGLRASDQILEINGKKITNGEEMISAIHNSPGKEVTLLVDHEGKRSVRKAVPRWFISYIGANWSFMNGERASVEGVDEKSVAGKAGIQSDDKLISINGKPIIGGAAMDAAIRANGTNTATLELQRKNITVRVQVKPMPEFVSFAGAKWYFPGAIAYKLDKPNAKDEAIKIGDRLLSVDSKKIKTGEQIIAAAQSGKNVSIEIKRELDTKPLQLSVSPGKINSALYEATGMLGFTPQFAFVKKGFTDSLRAGWDRTTGLVSLIFAALAPKQISKNVGGPVMIYKQTSSMIALGPYYVVQMIGMLSMSLAIINMVPIPAILDGGHILLLGIEAIRKKRWSQSQMQAMQLVGFAMVAVLFVLIFVSDITKIISGQVPQ